MSKDPVLKRVLSSYDSFTIQCFSIMWLFIFVQVFLILQCAIHTMSEDIYSSMKIHLTQRGLDFVNEQVSIILNRELANLSIPDSKINNDLRIWNVRITKFQAPTYNYTLLPPSGLSFGLENGGAEIQGTLEYCKTVIFQICKTLDFTANGNPISLRMSVNASSVSDGHPQITSADCQITIENFTFNFHNWFVDILRSIFVNSNNVKTDAQKVLCNEAKKFILNDFNAMLGSFPVKTKIGFFEVDFGLATDPLFSDDFVELDLKGKFLLTIVNS